MVEIDADPTRRDAVITLNALLVDDPVAEQIDIVIRMALDGGFKLPQRIREDGVVVAKDDVVRSRRLRHEIITVGRLSKVRRLTVKPNIHRTEKRPNGGRNSVGLGRSVIRD